jgi:hypothetical protein
VSIPSLSVLHRTPAGIPGDGVARRHRRAAGRTPLRRGTDIAARTGSLVSLAALLVVGVAVATALDSGPAGGPAGPAALTVRFADR